MNAIDPRTVLLLTGIMGGLMSLVLYALKRNYPASIKGLGDWSAALLLLFAGGLLVAGRGKLPNLVSISVSSFLLWSGLYLAYVGSQRFFGAKPRIAPWMALITGVALVQLWFSLVEPSYHMRLVLTTVVTACLSGVHAWLVFRQGSITFSRGLAVGVLVFLFGAQVMRLVTSFSAHFPLNAEFFDTSSLQLTYITSFAFSVLLFSISAVLMATDRLRIELEHLANHDSLTNALTRRHMDDACRSELERCRRHGRSMALLIMDLDHFKEVNDTHGHQAGDQALINFVAGVNALLRGPDQLGRFGGEEFVALLPETSLDEAIAVAERIRGACTLAGQAPTCTVSIGVTTNRKDNDSVDTLLARADAALYRAKAAGRNRVEVA
ncbi:diguanylate cyclase [Rhodoferax ferrireducens]|uniref:diguanylate cyclase n=1 Tax=Rhodoferax ferrireducens TaxID=192843 RepID=UPI00298DCF91|nr:diguanylate cyclase [Rhodoferax ferrireducens]WPC65484.1 diguanylate cyclase [Rhodoferax ferrireducens]